MPNLGSWVVAQLGFQNCCIFKTINIISHIYEDHE